MLTTLSVAGKTYERICLSYENILKTTNSWFQKHGTCISQKQFIFSTHSSQLFLLCTFHIFFTMVGQLMQKVWLTHDFPIWEHMLGTYSGNFRAHSYDLVVKTTRVPNMHTKYHFMSHIDHINTCTHHAVPFVKENCPISVCGIQVCMINKFFTYIGGLYIDQHTYS